MVVLENYHFSDSEILQEAICYGQMDIANVSTGSVVILLKPLSDQAIQTLLYAKDNMRIVQMIIGMLRKIDNEQFIINTDILKSEFRLYIQIQQNRKYVTLYLHLLD